jgi:hypothetical protein
MKLKANSISGQATPEFPWMASLPPEQKRRIADLWVQFRLRQPEPVYGVLLRLSEACRLLGLARHQLALMAARGRIASFRRGGARLIRLDAMEAFARSWRGKRLYQPQRPWTQPEDALLGTFSDPVLARKLGRSQSDVLARRSKLSVRSYRWKNMLAKLAATGNGPRRGVAAVMWKSFGWN